MLESRMRMILPLALLPLALLIAAPAAATEVVRLSPAERDAVIAAAANGPERSAVLTAAPVQRRSVLDTPLYPEFYGEAADGGRDRKIHGEVTMFAGSGGTFGMSGTAIIPVGETGTAAISVLQGTSNRGGLQGFSLGFASGNAQNNLGGIGGYNAFGGWTSGLGNGLGNGWGNGLYPGRPPRRR